MSLTLATTETITGVAGSATSITYTIFGDEITASGDAFKVLAQGQLPSSVGTLYTVPASTVAIVKAIHLVNGTGGSVTARLNVKGTAAANAILPAITILAGGFAIFGDDGWNVYNDQGQKLGVGATGATGATGAAGADGLATSGTPAVVLSTTAAAGVAATALATDAQIIAFDVTVPSTQALGDAAATGSAAVTARRDHKHAMPALSTATPIVASGSGAVGTAAPSSREDHVHPAGAGSGTVTTVKDEGSNLSTAVVSLDFVGAGVTATGTTAVTVTIPGGGGSHSYVGYNTIGGTTENTTNLRVYMKKITLASAGVIVSIGAYLGQFQDVATSFAAAIYSDIAGAVGVQLASTTEDTHVYESAATPTYTVGWRHRPMGLYCAAGDYWIAFRTSASLVLYYDGSGSDRYYTAGGSYFADGGRFSETDSTRIYSFRASVLS